MIRTQYRSKRAVFLPLTTGLFSLCIAQPPGCFMRHASHAQCCKASTHTESVAPPPLLSWKRRKLVLTQEGMANSIITLGLVKSSTNVAGFHLTILWPPALSASVWTQCFSCCKTRARGPSFIPTTSLSWPDCFPAASVDRNTSCGLTSLSG